MVKNRGQSACRRTAELLARREAIRRPVKTHTILPSSALPPWRARPSLLKPRLNRQGQGHSGYKQHQSGTLRTNVLCSGHVFQGQTAE